MTPKPVTCNRLFYGDDLPILREHVADERVERVDLNSLGGVL
jgi:hypothetical protein